MASSGPSRAAAWTLSLPTSSQPAESALLPDDGSRGSSESIIGEDLRQLVDPQDFYEGGKYRSIVKIQSRFQDRGRPIWMMGSGWLIRPDLLVTAGHVVYDWGRNLGATDQIRCYIGYNGKESVKSSQVQVRSGAKVVTPVEWIENSNNRRQDVAFIRLDRPFTGNLRLFSYLNTPEKGNGTYLGVVGYPGDKTLQGEQGAQMYEEFARSDWNIGESPHRMVEYSISTFSGQSGAPVLRKSDGRLNAIGTHSYARGSFDKNAGTTIGNAYGNNYNDLISLFDKGGNFGDVGTVKTVQVQTQDTTVSSSAFIYDVSNPWQPSMNEPQGLNRGRPGIAFETPRFDEESFLDTLKTVANVGRKGFPFASALLGPIGGPLSAVVGTLLGSLTESTLSQSTESIANGPAERAILAEAALQAVLASDHDEHVMEVINNMGQIWKGGAPKAQILAPAITPILGQCSVELSSQASPETENARGPRFSDRRRLEADITESAAMNDGAAFIQGILGPTRQLEGGKDVSEWLGPVLVTAVSESKPLTSKSASAALSRMESIEAPTSSANEDATRILIKRAVLADAALQAVMSLPRERLERFRPTDGHGDDAGIFDFMKDKVQILGPATLDIAKKAAIKIGPRISSGASSDRAGPDTEVPRLPQRAKKPSLMDYLNQSANRFE
ncbi:glutamyl endopeptidase [Fusarium pseudoanthophilum]|uniref:Glutamyl endopeptidase n=1 Tax=Fusarium pseudoanthophilum TaxID=48495 RepID=A0A8H5PRM9_9HYPO|nr:glutamyl endopeptidase [Fusarium pseudoanthophilum]